MTPQATQRQALARTGTEKMISQIPPKRPEGPTPVEHVAGLPVRNPAAVELGRHYGLTIATCVPYDPASKGGSESTVKIAKADLVPADANLLPEYGSFAGLEQACAAFCELVNALP